MQLFVTQPEPTLVVALDRYWNALKMNAGDIEKLKGIYADDFTTLGSLSKIITKQNLETVERNQKGKAWALLGALSAAVC